MSLPLVVGVIMTLGGYFILGQRTGMLESAMRNELRAHAITLQIALQNVYGVGKRTQAQKMIDQLSENPKVFSVILSDEQGHILMLSNPTTADTLRHPPEIQRVLKPERQWN